MYRRLLLAITCFLAMLNSGFGDFSFTWSATPSILVNYPFSLEASATYWPETGLSVTLSRRALPSGTSQHIGQSWSNTYFSSVSATLTHPTTANYEYMMMAESYDSAVAYAYLYLQATSNSAPTASVTVSPSNYATRPYAVGWHASDPDQNLSIAYLEVTPDTNQAPTVADTNQSPYGGSKTTHLTAPATAGAVLYFRVRAVDMEGVTTISAWSQMTFMALPVDPVPTITWLQAPANTVSVNAPFVVQARAADANGDLTNISLWRDGVQVSAISGTGAQLDSAAVTFARPNSGDVLYRAVATDALAHTVTSWLSVRVIGTGTPSSGDAVSVASTGGVVGTLPGNLSVDNKGSANYSIPLTITPGRGGMQPSLALSYSSGGGNGPLGIGFSLSTGFPQSITRGRSILARDGAVRGATFDDTNTDESKRDKFYLDGKRLICVSGSYGSPGSKYRTEVDSFVTVTTEGSGSNIDTFTVTDKSGTQMLFGKTSSPSTNDGYQSSVGDTQAYTYAIKRVKDVLGNYIEFNYHSVGDGEHVLANLKYTGNSSVVPKVDPQVQVTFSYNTGTVDGSNSRRDASTSYVAGRRFSQTWRLDQISVTMPVTSSTPTAIYNLGYEYAPNQGRTRLKTVAAQLRDPNGATMKDIPATRFHWSDNSIAFNITDPTHSTDNNNTQSGYFDPNMPEHYAFGDVNGDGKDDFVGYSSGGAGASISNGTDFVPSFGSGSYFGSIGFPLTIWKLADVNGDGKKDVIGGGIGTQGSLRLFCVVSTGEGFVPLRGGTTATEIYTGTTDDWVLQEGELVSPQSIININGERLDKLLSRVSAADFTGDGLDDVLIHRLDGKLRLLRNRGDGTFEESTHDVGARPVTQVPLHGDPFGIPELLGVRVRRLNVSMIPCELNGDGITDYAWSEKIPQDVTWWLNDPNGPQNFRHKIGESIEYYAVTSQPGGGFSPRSVLWSTEWTADATPPSLGDVNFRRSSLSVMPCDLNGDGLTDFMVLAPEYTGPVPGRPGLIQFFLWHQALISKGASGRPEFEHSLAVPEGPVIAGNQQVYPWFDKVSLDRFLTEYSGSEFLNLAYHPQKYGTYRILGGVTGEGSTMCDVNLDGRDDFVWFVPEGTSKGWWVMYTLNSGYSQPAPAPMGWLEPAQIGQNAFYNQILVSSRLPLDLNGDGIKDYAYGTHFAHESPGYVGFHTSAAPKGDRITAITDGIGRRTDVEYKPITDDSVYTPGAVDNPGTPAPPFEGVKYPIRELRNATYVVSNVWHDSGADGQPAQFSYQYSGNRLDLSGRGSLGFHSFVTLDQQTKLFKYQFLAQSFPMTGLTHREQTFRYWESGTSPSVATNFRTISSHDNTVVFDKVMNGAAAYGTVYPFISKAVESRWEDSLTAPAHFGYTKTNQALNAPLEAKPESIFPDYVTNPPSGAHITITAKSWFDDQDQLTDPLTTLPSALNTAGYYPSDLNGAANKVAGIQPGGTADPKVTGSLFSNLPGKITYGNLTQLFTNFEGGFTEKVITGYYTPVQKPGFTGLVKSVTTKVTAAAPYQAEETAPVKRFDYKAGTPLLEIETIDAGAAGVTNANSALNLTTTHTRDALGRVTNTQITGSSAAGDYFVGDYSASSVPTGEFDAKWDLPTSSRNAEPYHHTTTTTYHPFLGKPISVTDVNNAQVATVYDALGRAIQQTDVLKNLTTNTTFAWDTSVSVSPPESSPGVFFNGVAAGSLATGVKGVTLTSAYKVTTTATVAPSTTAYYDRLGRVIRTIKDGYGTQKTVTDAAYNNLGQTVATSLPYLADPSPQILWTKSTYDALGRVVTVTAPNGTVTTNTYNARLTTVSVDAPALGGVDPAPQINSTLVDYKGRTVKVWNNDNRASGVNALDGTGGNIASIAFALDGFGRMGTTTLLGQTQTIIASYDALGRQLTLNDPDKGLWQYTNNALGQVTRQTDAKQNVTTSTFDTLGRPLIRTTTSLGTAGDGSTETAKFYYYDTAALATPGNAPLHLVAKGAKGWIGAPEREEAATTDAPGFNAPKTINLHYYNEKGLPSLELAQTDGKWFYTYSDYDAYSRVRQVRHYWKPADDEDPADKPYLWQDFGYTYTYDGSGAASKSYLISLTDSLGRSWWDNPEYDYMDRVKSVRKGGYYTTERTYRASDGVLSGLSTTDGLTTVQNMAFGFDGLGNLTSRADTAVSGYSNVSETLTYDILNRLENSKQGTTTYETNGNIRTKPNVDIGGPASGTYGYAHPTKPHAVTSAFGYDMTYDANGNIESRLKTNDNTYVKWAGFDKPRWLTRNKSATITGSEFHYNAARSRVMQMEFDSTSGAAASQVPLHYNRKRTYALGSTLELNYDNTASGSTQTWALKKVRIYVPGPDGIIGAREFDVTNGTTGTEKALVYHYDHLGSITATTLHGQSTLALDGNNKPGKFSEDAWGQRRDPVDWIGAADPAVTDDGHANSVTPRGYTGHEMLDDLGLVHMNGRIYDPLLGRFLSADTLVESAGDLQSYNRYSYVRNNPLRFVDPTGFNRSDLRDDQEFIAKKRADEAKKNPPPPPDKYEGKENWRQFMTYLEKSPGGQARIVLVSERTPTNLVMLDPNAPKTEHVETVSLQDTTVRSMLTQAEGANLSLLNMTPSRKSALLTSDDMTKSSTEVKQQATEVSQQLTRDGNGQTRSVGVRSPTTVEIRGQIQITDVRVQANGKALGSAFGLYTKALEGAKEAAAMTEVRVNLVYGSGGFMGLFPSRPTGEIVVQRVSDMNRVQDFAEHHDLPAVNITDRTVTVGEKK